MLIFIAFSRQQWFGLLLALSLMILSPLAQAGIDPLAKNEIDLREDPTAFYLKMLKPHLPNPLPRSLSQETNELEQLFLNSVERLSPQQQFQLIYYVIAADLNPSFTVDQRVLSTDFLMNHLSQLVSNNQQLAISQMLQGRYLGRIQRDFPQSIEMYQQALASLVDSPTTKATHYVQYNIFEHLQGLFLLTLQYEKAKFYLDEYVRVASVLDNLYLKATTEMAVGKFAYRQQIYDQAIHAYTRVIDNFNNDAYPKLFAEVHFNLAKVYRDSNQFTKALEHAHHAVKNFRRLDNKNYLAHTMTLIGILYHKQENLAAAMNAHLDAYQIHSQNNNFSGQAISAHNLGEVYLALGETDKALQYLLQANQFFIENKQRHYLPYSHNLVAKAYLKQQQWQTALEYAQSAYPLAQTQKLFSEQIDLLQIIIQAQLALANDAALIQSQQQLIALLKQQQVEQQQQAASKHVNNAANSGENAANTSLNTVNVNLKLTELDLSIAQQKLQQQEYLLWAAALCGLLLMAALLSFSKKLAASRQQLQQTTQQLKLEPHTQQRGINALLADLSETNQQVTALKCLGLLQIPIEEQLEIRQGQAQATQHYQQQLTQLEYITGLQSYAIRPGLIAFTCSEHYSPATLLQLLQQALAMPQLLLGLVHLPLIHRANTHLDPSRSYETAQFALHTAKRLVEASTKNSELPNSISQGQFVALSGHSLSTVEIFTSPLYSHLQQAITHGMINIELSDETQQLPWLNQQSKKATLAS